MTSTSDLPPWMQKKTNEEAVEEPSSTVDDVAASSPVVEEEAADTTTTAAAHDSDTPTGTPKWKRFSTILFYTVSLLLCGLFIYAAIVQNNDNDAIVWYLYYALCAVLPVTVMLYSKSIPAFSPKMIYLLVIVLSIYSTVLMIMAAVRLAGSTDDDQPTDNGADSKKEEFTYELAGAAIGFISALYHASIVKFCLPKKNSGAAAAAAASEEAGDVEQQK